MGKKITKKDDNNWSLLLDDYLQSQSKLVRFCEELKHQIEELVDAEKIILGFPLEYRVKSFESIKKKAESHTLRIASIAELSDLCGLRIILLFKRDVEKINQLLEGKFEIIEKEDKLAELSDDEFGYGSIHYILKFPADWVSVPSLANFANLTAEVQVRTVAQHIWAASSHILQYKEESSVPYNVRRAIYRASALLETVDLEFERVLEKREQYRETILEESTEGALNVDLLEKILDEMLPPENKDSDDGEDYEELLYNLRGNGIEMAEQLRNLIVKHREEVMEEEQRRVLGGPREDYSPRQISRFEHGVFFKHTGLLRILINFSLPKGKSWTSYMQENKTK